MIRKKTVEDRNGVKREIEVEVDDVQTQPFQFDPPLCVKAVEFYRTLFEEGSELYWLINDLICSPVSRRNYYKRILASVLNDLDVVQFDDKEKV